MRAPPASRSRRAARTRPRSTPRPRPRASRVSSVTQLAGPSLRRRVAPESARERQVQGQSAGETDEPAGAADPYRPRKQRSGAGARRRGRPAGRVVCRDRAAASGPPATLLPVPASEGHYGARHAPVCREAVSQDERRPVVEALRRAQETAFGPGEYVEQESFVRASEILALAETRGRRLRRLRSRPVLRNRRAGTAPDSGARLQLRRRRRECKRRRCRA